MLSPRYSQAVRSKLTHHFVSAGRLPWQDRMIACPQEWDKVHFFCINSLFRLSDKRLLQFHLSKQRSNSCGLAMHTYYSLLLHIVMACNKKVSGSKVATKLYRRLIIQTYNRRKTEKIQSLSCYYENKPREYVENSTKISQVLFGLNHKNITKHYEPVLHIGVLKRGLIRESSHKHIACVWWT